MRDGQEQKIVYKEGEQIRSLWGQIEEGPPGYWKVRRHEGDILINKAVTIKVEARRGC